MKLSYEQIPAFLPAAVPQFAQSREWELLDGVADDLPGVVLASFAKFLARLSRDTPSSEEINLGLEFAALLWSSDDGRILVAMRDEFFEALESDPVAVEAMLPRMDQDLREGYVSWTAGA
jgi:hypothetical protein